MSKREHHIQQLKGFVNFEQVPDEQLGWLYDNSTLQIYDEGQTLMRANDVIDEMMLILEGEIRIQIGSGGKFSNLGSFEKGEILGKLPFSRMQSSIAQLTIMEKTVLLRTHESLFPEISKYYELIGAFVHSMSDRIRYFTSRQQQNEKMIALGKLSAGLAHELNNPAAAMVRSATSLRKNLHAKPEKFKAVINIKLSPEQVETINKLVFAKAGKGINQKQSLMRRTALEDELADWLEHHGVENAFELAETFAEYQFSIADLESIKAHINQQDLAPIMGWVEDVLITEKMVEEIEDSARKISDLVASVKTYSHMDRGGEKEIVDLHKMLNSTITMLNHKSKSKQVQISINIAEELPPFLGYVSELNQVWTNLIDNAIDAVGQNGAINISAKHKNGSLLMHFADNGTGIPVELKNNIFDPFFTTKDVGKGTGLGLDVVHKIVAKHGGRITVESEPGNTVFELNFPLI
jgi:signal transduction histidine kinase